MNRPSPANTADPAPPVRRCCPLEGAAEGRRGLFILVTPMRFAPHQAAPADPAPPVCWCRPLGGRAQRVGGGSISRAFGVRLDGVALDAVVQLAARPFAAHQAEARL